MSTFEFELVVTGLNLDDDDQMDALYARADDATASGDGKSTVVGIEREADSLLDAVVSAIADVEADRAIRVLRIQPDEFVWASEIAERTGRSRQNIDQLIRGQRGPGAFPPPVHGSTRNPLWRWDEVVGWFASYDGSAHADPERSTVLGAINAALEARRHVASQPKLRRAVANLLKAS